MTVNTNGMLNMTKEVLKQDGERCAARGADATGNTQDLSRPYGEIHVPERVIAARQRAALEKARQAKGKKRLAVMGGTFDPPHRGHLRVALEIAEALRFDRILVLPDCIPPHKVGKAHSAAADRVAMLHLMLDEVPLFQIDEREIRRGGLSYTYTTLQELRAEYPEYELYFIIGGDSAEQLHTWYHARELLEQAVFVTARRPGYAPNLDKLDDFFGPRVHERLLLVDTCQVPISSTAIRERARQGLPLGEFIDPRVAQYIETHKLYR